MQMIFVMPLVALGGCATNVDLVKTQAAKDFSCAQREIAIVERREDIQEPTYEIEACGHRARYSCHDRRKSVIPSQQQAAGCSLDITYP